MKQQHAATAAKFDANKVLLTKDPLPDTLLALCEQADSPRSLAIWLCYKYKEYLQLVSMEIKTSDYEPVFHTDRFQLDYLCTKVLSKYQNFDLGLDLKAVALQKWLATESRCAQTNDMFRSRWDGKSSFTTPVEEAYYLARRKLREILKSVDVEYIRSHCNFGPGADLDTERDNTSRYHKFGSDGSCTPWIMPLYDEIFSNEDSDYRGEFVHRAKLCTSSRLSFVAKSARTDRAICIEPRWNVYLQIGIGRLIQKRLLRVGMDITTQENNQRAAQRAYTDGLATIDLSSASDSISTNLVIDMFAEVADPLWLDLILKSRCPYTEYKGERIRLNKVSSMGNGYTFPLETLIFYCLSYGAMVVSKQASRLHKDLWVYGDDIVVPGESAQLLLEVLQSVGFEPNRDKTFISGDFYESCGTDYYRGRNVRPFFIKKSVRSCLDAYVLANQIAAYAVDFLGDLPNVALREIWNIREHIIRRIPRHLRCFGPPEASDLVLRASFDVALPQKHPFWEGYTVRALVAKTNKYVGFNFQGHLYSKLSGDLNTGQKFLRRKSVRYALGRVYVPTYTDVMLI